MHQYDKTLTKLHIFVIHSRYLGWKSCADPESFVRVGPSLASFFS